MEHDGFITQLFRYSLPLPPKKNKGDLETEWLDMVNEYILLLHKLISEALIKLHVS